MAVFTAVKGQTVKVPLTIQFTDSTGAAVDPTGTVNLRVMGGDPLAVKATLNPTKQLSLLGFFGAFLDVSDGTLYPDGEYPLRWDATVGGVATAATDYLEILPGVTIPGTGASAGAYVSEAEVRNWARPLESAANFPAALVAEKAAQAADRIDNRLRRRYSVPFASPYPDEVVLLNIWLAAAFLLENRQGEAGNVNPLARELLERWDEEVAAIERGDVVLSVAQRTDSADASQKVAEATTESAKRLFELDLDDPTSTPLGRF